MQTAFAQLKLFTEPYVHQYYQTTGRQPILKAIYSAKKSIDIEIYLLTDKRIINALIKRARAGIKIRIILEQSPYNPNNSYSKANKWRKLLKSNGINIESGNPKFSLTHEKAIVIDNNEALIMTLNLTYSAFKWNREYGIIDDADVQEIEQVFNADWHRNTPTLTNKNLLWSPVNSQTRLLNLIKSAKQSIIIENEEFIDKEIARALVKAAKKHINIKLILPKRMAHKYLVKKLIRNGAHVKTLDPAKNQLNMHAKMMVVDNTTAYVGSINFSYSSLQKNRELGILIHAQNDADVITQLTKVFYHDWNNAATQV